MYRNLMLGLAMLVVCVGYGDMVMSEQSRLLGAFEAGNGVLMLGLTTSILFLVLNTALKRVWDERFAKGGGDGAQGR